MKRIGKPWFFIVAVIIVALTLTSFFGISNWYGDTQNVYIKGASDIRWGIDIQGGVEAVFAPDIQDEAITNDDMDAAKEIIETRLIDQSITDYEVYTDYDNHQVIVRFPWKSGESDFDPTTAVQELGETALLTFCEGNESQDTVILSGAADIAQAQPSVDENGAYVVQLTLTTEGAAKFAEATARLQGDYISIWMDDIMISAPTVNAVITDGNAIISGSFDADSATELANKINAGSLPFALTVDDSKLQIVSPTLGNEALSVMLIAGAIAFVLICLLMMIRYRVPGVIASIALLGQVAGMVASISGYFPGVESFTLTIPGIAGMILSIGIGVDCNVITAERIKEEFRRGRTIDGAVAMGYKNALSAIVDGNVTVVIVAIVLMGAFGTPNSFMYKVLSPLLGLFSSSISGSIYSFGYTLLMGVVFNLVMGVLASRLMMVSLIKFKPFRKPSWFGAAKTEPAQKPSFNFVKHWAKFLSPAAVLLVVAVIMLAVCGLDLDINFKGGSRFTYTYTDTDTSVLTESDAQDVIQSITATDENGEYLICPKVEVAISTGISDTASKKLVVSVVGSEALTAEEQAEITAGLQEAYPDHAVELGDSNTVNPTVAHSFFAKAIAAVVLAAVLVVIYVGIRFRKIGGISAALTGLLALVIDCIFAFSSMAIFRLTIDMNFVAVILTLLGYSLNDTIVIYDRIRENQVNNTDQLPIRDLVNRSCSQVKVRTLTTTITTVIAVVTIWVVAELSGLSSLRTFVIPMAFGLISGCLTSLCVASPIWVRWCEHKANVAPAKAAAKKAKLSAKKTAQKQNAKAKNAAKKEKYKQYSKKK